MQGGEGVGGEVERLELDKLEEGGNDLGAGEEEARERLSLDALAQDGTRHDRDRPISAAVEEDKNGLGLRDEGVRTLGSTVDFPLQHLRDNRNHILLGLHHDVVKGPRDGDGESRGPGTVSQGAQGR